MANLLRSFSTIGHKVITEVFARSLESEVENTENHEVIETLENWNPLALHATDVYKLPLSFVLKCKSFLK